VFQKWVHFTLWNSRYESETVKHGDWGTWGEEAGRENCGETEGRVYTLLTEMI